MASYGTPAADKACFTGLLGAALSVVASFCEAFGPKPKSEALTVGASDKDMLCGEATCFGPRLRVSGNCKVRLRGDSVLMEPQRWDEQETPEEESLDLTGADVGCYESTVSITRDAAVVARMEFQSEYLAGLWAAKMVVAAGNSESISKLFSYQRQRIQNLEQRSQEAVNDSEEVERCLNFLSREYVDLRHDVRKQSKDKKKVAPVQSPTAAGPVQSPTAAELPQGESAVHDGEELVLTVRQQSLAEQEEQRARLERLEKERKQMARDARRGRKEKASPAKNPEDTEVPAERNPCLLGSSARGTGVPALQVKKTTLPHTLQAGLQYATSPSAENQSGHSPLAPVPNELRSSPVQAIIALDRRGHKLTNSGTNRRTAHGRASVEAATPSPMDRTPFDRTPYNTRSPADAVQDRRVHKLACAQHQGGSRRTKPHRGSTVAEYVPAQPAR